VPYYAGFIMRVFSAARLRAGALVFVLASNAGASAADTGVSPGFYKFKLGAVTVVALSDGSFGLPASGLVVEARKGEVRAALAKAGLGDTVPTSVNAFLVDTGKKRILIDTGSGSFLGPTLGQVARHLREAGYKPQEIDEVLITHLHADHVGGLIDNGKLVYPNATVRVDERELAFWKDRRNAGAVDASVQATFDVVVAALKPYGEAGHIQTFQAGDNVEPDITAVPEPGHTVGHTGFRVENDGNVLLIWGDLVHLGIAQFPDPKVTIKFDSTPAAAVASREQAFALAARGGYYVAGAHIDFPGIGKVTRSAGGFTWTPLSAVRP
jgi:glyoxylase-like metal-dependent hydrolase (beta-lactamase superfamily II)